MHKRRGLLLPPPFAMLWACGLDYWQTGAPSGLLVVAGAVGVMAPM